MSDYYIIDSNENGMFEWIEQHDKICPFAYKGLIDRFKYSEVINDNVCIIRVTCLCKEMKVVTVCSKE